MNTKNHKKVQKINPNSINRKSRKFLIYRGIDFDRVENAPKTKLEREIQKKLARIPSPAELVIPEEEKKAKEIAFKSAVKKVPLTKIERNCLNLTLKGMNSAEIGKKLGIHRASVHIHLRRLVSKIRRKISFEIN